MTKALGGRVSVESDISGKFSKDAQSILVDTMEYNSLSDSYPFEIQSYQDLREITILDCNYSLCSSFVLSDLPLLQTLIVGDNSFNLGSGIRMTAAFSITNCPSLTTITIGESFHNYTSFHLSGGSCDWCMRIDCGCLQSFIVKSHMAGAFAYVKQLSLKSFLSFWFL